MGACRMRRDTRGMWSLLQLPASIQVDYCPCDGVLVGADYVIPEEPSEFHRDDRLPEVLGCNHLLCHGCKSPVRNASHFGSRPGFGRREPEVYEAEDWRSLGSDVLLETPGYIGRFYVCRCTHHVECHIRLICDPDAENSGVTMPWRCGGHPQVTLPLEMPGVRIDESTDLAGMVERSFRGEDPPAARAADRALPTGWVTRLYFLLEGTPARRHLARSVAGALESENTRVRSCALFFFARFAELPEAEAVARAATRHPERFHGVRDATRRNQPLETRLRSFLSKRIGVRDERGRPLDPIATELARSEVGGDGDVTRLLLALASVDDSWLADHAVALVGAHPERAADLVEALAQTASDRTATVVRELLEAGLACREALRRRARKNLDKDERAIVFAALRKPHRKR